MFKQLTNYLLQYRQVSIPSVGTIRLVRQPAQLDVAAKIITPPSYRTEITSGDAVPEHQLAYLSASLGDEKHTVLDRLSVFGQRLQQQLRGDGFDWKGIGLIESDGGQNVITPSGLQPIPAERVLRQDAEHNVLVGDQEMTSTQMTGRREEVPSIAVGKRSLSIIIGWVLLAFAILFIVFLLYQGKFRIGATGSKQSPIGFIIAPSKNIT
ncbi:MAG: hypothetical protein EOO14_04985 [Chitinophagaceae bacterium]|nr:MAG: hypothetical protein EOO14_04985 [Chitinophagaceae bacterium]